MARAASAPAGIDLDTDCSESEDSDDDGSAACDASHCSGDVTPHTTAKAEHGEDGDDDGSAACDASHHREDRDDEEKVVKSDLGADDVADDVGSGDLQAQPSAEHTICKLALDCVKSTPSQRSRDL